ncbi:MAG: kynureninase [Acidobacteria bacterium]|nr:kynureninase [Acidobacteriota bacterium]
MHGDRPAAASVAGPLRREDVLERDRNDPLASFRDRFELPEGVIYLDGNSLGPASAGMRTRIGSLLADEWGRDLVASWNLHGWFRLPERVGARIAPLLGAAEDEVIAADSVSLNLFKLLAALLRRPGSRRLVLAEDTNFPTDLYMAEGLVDLLRESGAELRVVPPDDFESALGPEVAVATLTQVDFRTGRKHDLRRLTAVARDAGIPIVWDLSHSAGAFPLHLNEDGVEFAVGCGYKYLNGGPGAPGFLYVARHLQQSLDTPLSGWMGHRSPFEFETRYRPAAGMRRFLSGTPGVLSMVALEEGLRTFEGVDLAALQAKSEALGDLLLRLTGERLGEFGVEAASPRHARERGSQVSLRHPDGYPVMQGLIARGVVGDFREPDLLRFGFAPLYVRYADVWDAVEALREVLASGEYEQPRFRRRNPVT